jgi:hypothetical protein
MTFIRDGHSSALGIEGIHDDVIVEDYEAEAKSTDHCVIKKKAQRALKFIR